MERALFILFLPSEVINGVKKPVQKEKLQFREQKVCARQMFFFAIFLFNKITALTFQIHIRDKTLDPCVNGGLERSRKFQTRL